MNRKRERGFTLLELMIVVAVIGILAAIAYPTFIDQVRKSRRADAKASLQALQLNQEKWRANHVSFTPTLANVWTGTDSKEGFYTLAITAASGNAHNATATPKAGTDQAQDRCGTFAINQTGPNGTGAYADVDGCWR